MSKAGYEVGRGKPPVQTRFKKGQSGNPSGKPGPAKLLRGRFHLALREALEEERSKLSWSKPASTIESVAVQLALDAAKGSTAAQRLLLSLLDAESGESAKTARRTRAAALEAADEPGDAESDAPQSAGAPPAERSCNEAQPVSLHQGNEQGSQENRLRELYERLTKQALTQHAEAEAGKPGPETPRAERVEAPPPEGPTIRSGTRKFT